MRVTGAATVGVAGWLFADLMLALAVLFLGGDGHRSDASAVRASVIVTDDAPAVTATASPGGGGADVPAAPPGLERTRVERTLLVREGALLAGDTSAVEEVREQVAAAFADDRFRGRRVGIALTFGRAPLGDPGHGVALAHAVNAILAAEPLFTGAALEDFLTFQPPPDANVVIWVYLLTVPQEERSER